MSAFDYTVLLTHWYTLTACHVCEDTSIVTLSIVKRHGKIAEIF
jgi:hypothetical protein